MVDDRVGICVVIGLRRLVLVVSLTVGLLLLPACKSADQAASPDENVSVIQVLSTQTHLVNDTVTVVGKLHNSDKTEHDVTLRAEFLDPSGQLIGNAEGVAEDIEPGETGDFEIQGKVDLAKYGTTRVTVVSLRERR